VLATCIKLAAAEYLPVVNNNKARPEPVVEAGGTPGLETTSKEARPLPVVVAAGTPGLETTNLLEGFGDDIRTVPDAVRVARGNQ